jgi:hypothetical protein
MTKDTRAAKAVGEIGISAGEKAACKSLFGKMSDEDARLYGKFLENGSTDGLTDAEQEAARKADKQKILNKIDTDELLKLRGGSEDIHIGGSKSIKNIIEMLKVKDLNLRRNLE